MKRSPFMLRNILRLMLAMLLACFFWGCSSDSSSPAATAADGGGGLAPVVKATTTATGAVGGTIVVAVVNNQIVSTYDTAGRQPDLDLDNDGFNEAFSFTLTGIPVDEDVQVFLIEDGWIFPVYFADGSGGQTNIFSLDAQTPVDFGFIAPGTGGNTGIALAANNIAADVAGLAPGVEDRSLPSALFQADVAGLDLPQLVQAGLDVLKEGWMIRAKGYFEAAAALDPEGNEDAAAAANFFLAATRVIELWFDMSQNYVPGGPLDNFGEILDRFGFEFSKDVRTNFLAIQPYGIENMPADCPTGAELQEFFFNVVKPQVQAAISNCEAITDTFAITWTVPFFDQEVMCDYTDVLFLKAGLRVALAAIQAQYHYDLDADFDAMMAGEQTMEDLFASGFLTPKEHWDPRKGMHISPTLMTDFRDNLFAAADDFWDGMEYMCLRDGSHTYFEDLFDLPSRFENPHFSFPVDLGELPIIGDTQFSVGFDLIDLLRAATQAPLDSGVEVDMLMDFLGMFLEIMGVDPEILPSVSGLIIYPSALWAYGGLDWNALMPAFEGNRVAGLFPDPSFDYMITDGSINSIRVHQLINMDINQDGAADLVQWLDPVDFLTLLYEDVIVEDLYEADFDELAALLPFYLDESLGTFLPSLLDSILYDYIPEQIGVFFDEHLNEDLRYGAERFLPIEVGIPIVEFFVNRAAQFSNPPPG